MEPWMREHIQKKEAERDKRKADFEDQVSKLFAILVENINPMRKGGKGEIIPFINYHYRTPFTGLMLNYWNHTNGQYNIELVNVRTYKLTVHYHFLPYMALPTEIVIVAKRPSRAQASKQLITTIHETLRKKNNVR